MTAARIAPHKAARLGRQSSAGDDPARLVPHHPWLKASAERPQNALSAGPALSQHPHSK
jgi:hypothetical protein